MIRRDLALETIRATTQAPAITLTGPRQSGKTTLCHDLFPNHPYRSLEAFDNRAFAREDPRAFLAQFPDGAVIDEVQRVPELLSYLQGIIDADPAPGRWILTGSQNLTLLESVSQSLAGRAQMLNLLPLTWSEITRFKSHPTSLEEALFSGGYPRIFDRGLDPSTWLGSYVATYIERDVRTIINVANLTTFQRFVELCAGRTGQLLNHSSLASDCGISQPTAKAWMSVLETSFITFRLPAFHANIRKRLVKMPKLYFYDTGLVCWLLGIREAAQLRSHPLRGPIFETWLIAETRKQFANRGVSRGLSFYRDRRGAEVDLMIDTPSRRTLLAAKSASTPSSSMFKGIKRVKRHLPESPPLDAAVVYGGRGFQARGSGRLIPWRFAGAASLLGTCPEIRITANGRPVEGADVLVLFPNKTWKHERSDNLGTAAFQLHAIHLPMTVFVAADGFKAHLERGWIPAGGELHISLTPLRDGGAVIFPKATGYVPGLKGRLNPIRDNLDRTYLYADNIAVNGGQSQPVSFRFGEEMHVMDADGTEQMLQVVEICGRAALVEYRHASKIAMQRPGP